MKYARFSLTSLLVLIAILAAFFAGQRSTLRERNELRLENEAVHAEARKLRSKERNFDVLSAMLDDRIKELAAARSQLDLLHGRYGAKLDSYRRKLNLLRTLRLVAWNVESGGNDPNVIAKQLVSDLARYDIYGLTEVDPGNTRLYLKSLQTRSNRYRSIVTVTGGSDRMLLVYDLGRFDKLEHAELEAHDGVRMNDVNFRHRSPLMARFKDKTTDVEFIVVLNHLARGNAELRQEQAKALRLWAAAQNVPVLAIGDYNFDYDFLTGKGNKAFDEFLSDGTWQWVKPEKLVDTNWSDRDEDGVDDYPDSCLDFMFVAGKAKEWQPESRVIVRDGDFPDDETTSDHRPVELVAIPQ